MIFREGELEVRQDKDGLYFHSDKVDLKKEKLSFPAEIFGVYGVIEFSERSVTIHPANDPSVTMTPEELLSLIEKQTGPIEHGEDIG